MADTLVVVQDLSAECYNMCTSGKRECLLRILIGFDQHWPIFSGLVFVVTIGKIQVSGVTAGWSRWISPCAEYTFVLGRIEKEVRRNGMMS